MTYYEQLIFDIVSKSTSHLTADQVLEQLRIQCPKVSRATVYNNLNKLCSVNLIRKVSLEGSPDRYDRIEKHDHLVCQECGKLADAHFSDLTQSLHDQVGDAFLAYDLKVFYICPECKERQTANTRLPRCGGAAPS